MYKYDALYRLVEATGRELTSLQLPTHEDFANNIAVPNTASNAMQNYTQQYQYDQLGNILQMKSVGNWTRDYFYNTNDNKLLGHTNGATEYTYDEHGNITAMPHLTQMNWDYKNQLLGATNGTFSSYYVYDATGNRVRKVVVKDNIVEERYYLGNYELFRKTTNGTLDFERKTVHVSDDQKKIATVETKTGETEVVRYQFDNHLGNASLELDENAAIISYEEYHPFGTTSYRSGRTETEVSLKRYKYVGKERDEETGLYYFGARYYASWIARFISVDPMKAERTWLTPYNYVQNNPINRTDPTGALDEEPPVEKKHGNIIFENLPARQVSAMKKQLLNDKLAADTTTNEQDKEALLKFIKQKEKDIEVRSKKAKKIDNALNKLIKADSFGLTHKEDKFSYTKGTQIKPLEEISEWAAENKTNVRIELGIEKIRKSTGESAYGSTIITKIEGGIPTGFLIKISPTSINPDWSLANEIGDVLFDTKLKDSEFQKEDEKDINNIVKDEKLSPQEAHDKVYDKLNSKKFSDYIETIYKVQLKKK